jgi:hypothetical protein
MNDEYRFFKLGTGSRIALAGSLWVAGAALELVLSPILLPGIALVLAGWLPLMLRKATNAPEDQGFEEWRPVTMAEVDRLDDGLRQAKGLRRKTFDAGSVAALGLGIPAALIAFLAAGISGRGDAAFVIANGAAFLFPAAAFGRIKVFSPREIGMKMPCFRAALSVPLPAVAAVAPYIRFDKDKAGLDVPEDLRLMLELKRPPADFVGIQIQAAINKGPNGEVPYLYAVVLTKGRAGPSYRYASSVRARGFEVEPGGEGDYGSVVIRQETSGTGYATSREDCEKLATVCGKVLQGIATA